MNAAEKLEREIKKVSGDRSEEIINAVRSLAEIDIEIKAALDEIERIDEDLVRRHNELADRINGIVESVAEENGMDEQSATTNNQRKNDTCLMIRVEVQIAKDTP